MDEVCIVQAGRCRSAEALWHLGESGEEMATRLRCAGAAAQRFSVRSHIDWDPEHNRGVATGCLKATDLENSRGERVAVE